MKSATRMPSSGFAPRATAGAGADVLASASAPHELPGRARCKLAVIACAEEAARLELLVLGQLLRSEVGATGQAGLGRARDDLLGTALGRPGVQVLVDEGAAPPALDAVIELRRLCPLRVPHQLAQGDPVVLLDRHDLDEAVGAANDAAVGEAAVGTALEVAVDVAADRGAVERELRVLHREVDALGAPGRARGAKAGQCGEGGVRSRLVTPDITADADRRAIRELVVAEAGRLQEAFTAALEHRQFRALPVALRAAAAVRRAGDHDAPALGQRGSLDDGVPAEGQRGALVDDDLDVGDLPGVGTGGEVARRHPRGEIAEEGALAAAPAAEEGRAGAQRAAFRVARATRRSRRDRAAAGRRSRRRASRRSTRRGSRRVEASAPLRRHSSRRCYGIAPAAR